jgi:enolase
MSSTAIIYVNCREIPDSRANPTFEATVVPENECMTQAAVSRASERGGRRLTETFNSISLAMRHGWSAVVSHRSGETEDPAIADIAVAANVGQTKTRGASRSDRVTECRQLLRIEEHPGDEAVFGGRFWNK